MSSRITVNLQARGKLHAQIPYTTKEEIQPAYTAQENRTTRPKLKPSPAKSASQASRKIRDLMPRIVRPNPRPPSTRHFQTVKRRTPASSSAPLIHSIN